MITFTLCKMRENKNGNNTQSVEKVQMRGIVKVKLPECGRNQ